MRSLLEGMLQVDIDSRFSLQQIRQHPWTLSSHAKDSEEVLFPPLNGSEDKYHTMTVLPYLMDHHYESDSGPTYYTERELNGKLIPLFL